MNRDPSIKESSAARIGYRASSGIAVIAGVFSLVVCILMGVGFARRETADPMHSKSLERLRTTLRDRQDDEALKEEIRALDQLARKAFFTSVTFLRAGAFLLLGGVLVLLIALKTMTTLKRKLPHPGRPEDSEEPEDPHTLSRWAVGGLGAAGVLVSVTLIIVTHGPQDDPKPPPGPATKAPPPKTKPLGPLPPGEEMLKNWPFFRGPGGLGVASHADPPVEWDGRSGKNVLWKARVPKPGYSSPVVWGNRVFITGGTKKAREVYCHDAGDGRLLWRWEVANVPGSPPEPPEVTEDTGYAAPTMALDGRAAFALFATGDLVCLDFDGKPIWTRNLGAPKNPYGHGSSLVTHRNLLLVQYDTGLGGRLLGLDAETGKTVWDAKRRVDISWATPIVVNTGERWEAILSASPLAASYDPETGVELWSVECMGGEVAPSPAFANGRVFVANANVCLVAIDIHTREIPWDALDDLPDVSSPLAAFDLLFVPNSEGGITCYDARKGKVLWFREFDHGFYASPILAGNRVYLMDLTGVMRIFMPDRNFVPLGEPALGEGSLCTPAFVGNRIFIRGDRHLFCIGTRNE